MKALSADAVNGMESPASGKDHSVPRPSGGSANVDGTPALSASIAHILVTRSTLHAWHAHPRLNPDYRQTESADFDYGNAAHDILLEGSEAKLYPIDAPDWRKKDAQEARENARKAGKRPLLVRQLSKVRAMVKEAQEYIAGSELAGIFQDGEPEVSLEWQEGQSRCRMRADWLTADNRMILDYKSSASANPDHFLRSAISYGYTMQEAFYRRGVKVKHGKEPKFAFLVQEKEPPYVCSLVAFDPAMQDMGDRQFSYALSLWQAAMLTGQWRGYPNRIAYLSPPSWYQARAEELDELLEQGEQA